MQINKLKSFVLASLMLATSMTVFGQKDWSLNKENSSVTFKILGEDDEGSLEGLEASIKFSPDALDESSFEAKIPITTINTGIEQRDDHLKKEDFFYAEKHPYIEFKSNEIIKTESGYLAKGDLTIRGNTMQVNLPFVWEPEKRRFVGRLEVKTKNYEVGDYDIVVRIVAAVE